jgi:hypothetical protein
LMMALRKTGLTPDKELTMSKAKRKNTTPAKNPDAELFRLHDRFCAAYEKMKKYDVPGKSDLSTGTKEGKRLHRKWESASNVAFDRGRAVIDALALTLEGMLMKLHIAGFVITGTKRGTFSGPYKSGTRLWEPGGLYGDDDEIAIIVSLRDDLHRFAGRLA